MHFFSFFGLNASRDAIGFRTNRSDQIDNMEERDLIKLNSKILVLKQSILINIKSLVKERPF